MGARKRAKHSSNRQFRELNIVPAFDTREPETHQDCADVLVLPLDRAM